MKYTCFFFCLLTSSLSFAIPPGQWQCIAFDAQERDFPAVVHSIQIAMKAAIERCKQESAQAKTCKSAQSFCEQGPLTLMNEPCLVTDDAGHSWEAEGDDSCKTAIAMCNQWQYLHGSTRSACTIKHGG